MKKILFMAAILALVPAVALAVSKGKGSGGGSKSGTMNVQVREVVVRATPNYLGSAAGTVQYGMQVSVLGEEGNWYQIDKPAGWVPKSALLKRKVEVDPDQELASEEAKHDEVALAGKGFKKIESEYQGEHPELANAFQSLERIDTIKVPETALRQFQKTGKLEPR